MRKMLFLLSGLMLVLLSEAAASGPGAGPLASALDQPSAIVKAQSCPKGQYFCPGQVSGCCPNGWGCGSTRCIAPKAPPPSTKNRCSAGEYYCPGQVSGCCPNGWRCGSTRCYPPKKEPVRYGNCYWDGTRPLCAGSCQNGFVVRKREGSGCITGSRVYCCEPMGSSSTP